jgi:hypothetical protein
MTHGNAGHCFTEHADLIENRALWQLSKSCNRAHVVSGGLASDDNNIYANVAPSLCTMSKILASHLRLCPLHIHFNTQITAQILRSGQFAGIEDVKCSGYRVLDVPAINNESSHCGMLALSEGFPREPAMMRPLEGLTAAIGSPPKTRIG